MKKNRNNRHSNSMNEEQDMPVNLEGTSSASENNTDDGASNSVVSSSIEHVITYIKTELGNPGDLVVRHLNLEVGLKIKAAVIFIDELVDSQKIAEFVIERLQTVPVHIKDMPATFGESFYFIKENSLSLGTVAEIENYNDLLDGLLAGNTAIYINGFPKVLMAEAIGGSSRAIQEPTSEVVIRGPKEAFTELLKTNIGLVRRKIRSSDLRVEQMKLGRVTKTPIALLYINNIADPKLIEEMKTRLERIDADSILESGQLEEFIQDETFTVFPQLFSTERPDVVAGDLLEGRVAVMVNGTPFTLIAPTQFVQFFQSPEDYYMRYDIGSFLRMLRFFVFIVSLIAPSIYIALTTFHQAMIPTTLLFGLAAQREGVPFPAFVEALMMEITFEILREAGIRMPRPVGVAVSIVGALVLGQAAVQAGLVSPVMVIVVGITAVASFAVPSFAVATSARLLRFPLMLISSIFGFYGLTLALIVIIAHLTSLRSFGVPYLSPIAPFNMDDMKDAFFRFPIKSMLKRPSLISQKNRVRMTNHETQKSRGE
ncbi:spore germination protein [Fictibacillus aquaticus]|nr:spore germination protein [Fictibacillus aquaticus]